MYNFSCFEAIKFELINFSVRLCRALHTTRNVIHINLCVAMLLAKIGYVMVFMAKLHPVSLLFSFFLNIHILLFKVYMFPPFLYVCGCEEWLRVCIFVNIQTRTGFLFHFPMKHGLTTKVHLVSSTITNKKKIYIYTCRESMCLADGPVWNSKVNLAFTNDDMIRIDKNNDQDQNLPCIT